MISLLFDVVVGGMIMEFGDSANRGTAAGVVAVLCVLTLLGGGAGMRTADDFGNVGGQGGQSRVWTESRHVCPAGEVPATGGCFIK